jgi:hypothetical protein
MRITMVASFSEACTPPCDSRILESIDITIIKRQNNYGIQLKQQCC